MKHLKFIHALTGLFALIALVVDGSLFNMSPDHSFSAPVLLLLSAALVNLSLGSYLTLFRCRKAYIQSLATLLLLIATVIPGWRVFNDTPIQTSINIETLVILLQVLAIGLHAVINLKSFSPGTITEVDTSDRETGTVKWFNITKGFGFITRDKGDDVFVHYRAIRGEGHRTLTEGQRVEFVVIEKDKGLQAEDVIAAPKGR